MCIYYSKPLQWLRFTPSLPSPLPLSHIAVGPVWTPGLSQRTTWPPSTQPLCPQGLTGIQGHEWRPEEHTVTCSVLRPSLLSIWRTAVPAQDCPPTQENTSGRGPGRPHPAVLVGLQGGQTDLRLGSQATVSPPPCKVATTVSSQMPLPRWIVPLSSWPPSMPTATRRGVLFGWLG